MILTFHDNFTQQILFKLIKFNEISNQDIISKSLNDHMTDFAFFMNLNKILNMVDSYKHIMIINVTFDINDRFITLILIIRIEVT